MLEEGEELGDPIGRPSESTNLDLPDLSDTEPSTMQHTLANLMPLAHIQKGTSTSGLRERRYI